MGIKSSSFVSMSGKRYSVSFSGNVVDGSLTFAGERPVVLSMSVAERKYVGFRTQECRVSVVTDKPLFDLYGSSATAVALDISSDSGVVFSGYVVPFAYSQPYTGCADVVELYAVDRLSARMEVPYANVGALHGVDVDGIDIVKAIAYRAGVYKIVEHVNFDVASGVSPMAVPVSQAGFLQDEVSEVDALSALCVFFGYTGHMYGDTLYLYDEHCLMEGYTDANVYTCSSGGVWSVTTLTGSSSPLSAQTVDASRIRLGVQVTVERAYAGVKIEVEGSDTSVLLPDVCQHMVAAGDTVTLQDYDSEEGVDYVQKRTPKRCTLMSTGLYADGGIVELPSEAVGANGWYGGSMPVGVVHMNRHREDVDDESVVFVKDVTEGDYMLLMPSLTGTPTVGVQYEGTRYSHTNGYISVRAEWQLQMSSSDNWIRVDSPVDETDTYKVFPYIGVYASGMRYKSDYSAQSAPTMVSGDGYTLLPSKGGAMVPSGTAQRISAQSVLNEWVLPSYGSGQVYVTLACQPIMSLGFGYSVYLRRLEVVGHGDPIDASCEGLCHRFRDGDDWLTATTRLTTRHSTYALGYPTGVNARPSVVPLGMWKGVYRGGGDTELMPIAGVLMEQLKRRYYITWPAYTMTVCDDLRPYRLTRYGDADYTVVGYEMDLYNNETKITID